MANQAAVAVSTLLALPRNLLHRCIKRRKTNETAEDVLSRDASLPTLVTDKTPKVPEQLRLDAFLPTPVTDRTLEVDLSRIETNIRNHAISFYTGRDCKDIDLDDDVKDHISHILGKNKAPIASHELAKLLASADNRLTAVRFLLGWAILQNIVSSADPDQTLLPEEYVRLMRAMGAKIETRQSVMFLESKWRQISGARLQLQYAKDSIDNSGKRLEHVDKLVTSLEKVLKPCANFPSDERRVHGMRAIITWSATYGFTLATQPTTWKFVWSCHENIPHHLPVFPDFVQIGDTEGRVRDPPIILAHTDCEEIMTREQCT